MRGVSFDVALAARLGIVGESGSGKSLTALSLMRLLPPRGRIAGGHVLLGGLDLARRVGARDGARSRRPDLDRLPGPDVVAEPAA